MYIIRKLKHNKLIFWLNYNQAQIKEAKLTFSLLIYVPSQVEINFICKYLLTIYNL